MFKWLILLFFRNAFFKRKYKVTAFLSKKQIFGANFACLRAINFFLLYSLAKTVLQSPLPTAKRPPFFHPV